ncbi:MAG TPA: iron-sulfur cluster assembly accessory protein [Mycobacteriales bacterium]|jgi:iron-sulfur cluster assembly accessory protein|nr:iron-sulfur cluster assembly accessory protein [Mycobacteriales bacterium]
MRFPPFTVTRPAIDQIEVVGGCVRVDLEPGGCSGRAYAWALADARPGDEVYGCEGAWLVVSADARPVLDGAVVDYGAALKPPRFRVVRNPNTVERCACNRSFGRPWPGRGHPDCRARDPMPWDG